MIKTLAKQSAIYGISTILGRLLSYLLTPYFTRIFQPAEYGVITDLYALIPFVLIVLSLSMESSYFRYAAKEEEKGGVSVEENKNRLFGSMWGLNLLLAALFFVGVWLFRSPLNALMGAVYVFEPHYIVLVAGIVFLDVASALPFARLREQGRAKVYVALKMFSIVSVVALAFLFGALGFYDSSFGVGWYLVANLLSLVLTFAALMFCSPFVCPRLSRAVVPIVMTYSFSLMLSGVAATATDFIDRQLIKYLIPVDSMAQLGIYGAVTKIAVVMTLFTQMYRLAAEPFFLSSFKEEDFKATNAQAMKYYIIFTIAIFLGISLFGNIFVLIVGPDYRESLHILPVVLLSNLLMGVWLNFSFWYKRGEQTKYALCITLLGMAVSVGSNILLLPVYGFEGAAWARLFAEVAMVLMSYFLMLTHCPINYNWARIAEYVLLGALIFGAYLLLPREELWVYAFSAVGLMSYATYAVWREKIDVKGLMHSVLKRR